MWRVVLLVMACGHRSDPPADAMLRREPPRPPDHWSPGGDPSPPVPPPPPPSHPQPGNTRRMHTAWGHVNLTQDTCWYFSGPTGRDTKLAGDVVFERNGETVKMTWGAAIFTGTYRDNVLALERKGEHQFDGRWTTKETFTGDYLGGKVIGKYHYEECHVGEHCPNECRIDGELVLSAT
jgi:hypothetical protein